jgi:hypothetical protein
MVHRVAKVAPAGAAAVADAGPTAAVAMVAIPAETPSAFARKSAVAAAADPVGPSLQSPLPFQLLLLRLDRALEALSIGTLPHSTRNVKID